MSEGTERFASALQRTLPESDGWKRTSSDLVAEEPGAPLLTWETRAAILVLTGDGIKPGGFRTLMEGLLRKAKAPPTPRQPSNPIPWNVLVVLMVFEEEFPTDMRTFIGNDRRNISPQHFIQGGWVDLSRREANFRTNRTPLETELLQWVGQAVTEGARGGRTRPSEPGRTPPTPGPAAPRAPGRVPEPRRASRDQDEQEFEDERPLAPGMRDTLRVRRDAQGRRHSEPPPDAWEDEEPERETDYGEASDGMHEFVSVLRTTIPWGTWLIMAVCAAVFGVTWYLGGDKNSAVHLRLGAQMNPLVQDGQWWRLGSAMFIHLGLAHFAVNMFSLYNIGPILERFYGNLTYLALYGLGGFAGSAAMLYFSPGMSISGGASGALFALCGATVIVGYRYRREIPASVARAMTVGLLPVLGYNLALGYIGNQVAAANDLQVQIGNAAHVGGLVAGILFALLVPSPKMRPSMVFKLIAPLLLVLAAAPFVAEGFAVYNARPNSEIVAYTAPAGYSFNRPASLLHVTREGAELFLGTDYRLGISAGPLKQPVDTVDRIRGELLQETGNSQGKSELVQLGAHRWLLTDTTAPDNGKMRIAWTVDGSNLYTVALVVTNPTDEASKAFQGVLESFSTPGSAGRVQPPSSVPSLRPRGRTRASGSPVAKASGSPVAKASGSPVAKASGSPAAIRSASPGDDKSGAPASAAPSGAASPTGARTAAPSGSPRPDSR